MPFESCFGRAFTALTVEREAPAASGVYGLSNSQRWIYISESDDIRASLMGYLAECGPQSQDSPTGFSFELSPAYSRIARCDRLIAELSPVQNPLVQNHGATALSRRRGRG
ncbi:MAG: hypothetical protein ABI833_09035 [Acidobacteriota bacterium]